MNSPSPLSPPQNTREELLKLQEYHAIVAQEYAHLLEITRSQLADVEALISGLSFQGI